MHSSDSRVIRPPVAHAKECHPRCHCPGSEHLNMTPYRLWKEAEAYCPTLSQSAVHEFIKGQKTA